jgi:hypothetical protein
MDSRSALKRCTGPLTDLLNSPAAFANFLDIKIVLRQTLLERQRHFRSICIDAESLKA